MGLEVGMPTAVSHPSETKRTRNMIIGVDPHKTSRTATAVDSATNTPVGSLRVDATISGTASGCAGPAGSVSEPGPA